MQTKADKPIELNIEEDEIKKAITEAFAKVSESASKTNPDVDRKHQLDFVVHVNPDGTTSEISVKTATGSVPSKKLDE